MLRLLSRTTGVLPLAFTAVFALALPATAQDAAQDAFIRAFRALDSFRQDAKFSTWLYRIAVNVSLTKARQSRLDVTSIDATMDDEDSAPLQIPDRALKPDEHIEQ